MGHILIIDREVTDTHPLTLAMAREGLAATVLSQGADALAWARQHRPDAIVLSVELQGVSGYAICNRLKKDEALRGIPLLLASSEASQEVFDEHRRLKTRADGYLFKPYDTEAVMQALRLALGQTATTPAPTLHEGPGASAAVSPVPQPPRAAAAPAADHDGGGADGDDDGAHDPLMSTDALLLLEGSVDVNKHTQVIRLPMNAKGEQAKDLIGAALADMDADAMAALTAMESRMQSLEEALRNQGSQLADQQALMTQLTDALARSEARQQQWASRMAHALQNSMQLCLDAVGDSDKTS